MKKDTKQIKIKIISLLLSSLIIVQTILIPSTKANAVNLVEEKIENQIKDNITEITDNVEIKNVNADLIKEKVVVEVRHDENEIVSTVDLSLSEGDELIDDDKITFEIHGDANTNEKYSVFYGTLEQKKAYNNAVEHDAEALKQVEERIDENLIEVLEQEFETSPTLDEPVEISPLFPINYSENNEQEIIIEDSSSQKGLEVDKLIENDQYLIESVEELENSPVVVTNLLTNEIIEIDETDAVGSAAFAISIGIMIAKSAVLPLIKAGSVLIVGGYVSVHLSKITTGSLSRYRSKQFNHYRVLRTRKGLYMSGGLSTKSAVGVMILHGDIWSNAQSRAKTVASGASLAKRGRKTPIGPEVDSNRKGKFAHYHTNPRKLSRGHSFYGGPN